MIKTLRIETNRLLIRPYIEDDLKESFELMQSKELFKYLDMDVMALDEYKNLFAWLIESYETPIDKKFKYSFAIVSKENGRFIGWCGVGNLHFNPSDKEIYYLIGREYWDHGYASEAVEALIRYCFTVMGLERLVAKVNPENIASKKIIEKTGFIFQHVINALPEKFSHCNGEW
jgi:ribosomal-protein-alanine N-acetyltransferase